MDIEENRYMQLITALNSTKQWGFWLQNFVVRQDQFISQSTKVLDSSKKKKKIDEWI